MSIDFYALDPAAVAPNLVVAVNPNGAGEQVGHGRTLPLIGNVRPHTFDVVFADGTKRVYADTPGKALCALIDGYEALVDEQIELEATIEQDAFTTGHVEPAKQQRASELYEQMWIARWRLADQVRVQVQQRENADSHEHGRWERLSSAEKAELESAAKGNIPLGLPRLVRIERGDPFGGPDSVLIEQGEWETDQSLLVINRGDYGPYSEEGVPEPVSTMTMTVGEGDDAFEAVVATPEPLNIIVLDPGDDMTLLESLDRADVVSLTVRPADLPDSMYTDAVEIGRKMIERDPELGRLTEVEAAPSADPDDHDHDHDHGHDHEHGHEHEHEH